MAAEGGRIDFMFLGLSTRPLDPLLLLKNCIFNFLRLSGFLFKFPEAIYDNWAHYEFSGCYATDGGKCCKYEIIMLRFSKLRVQRHL